MKKLCVICLSLFLMLGMVGCAGPKPLPEQAMFQQYPLVAQLKQELNTELESELGLLSPALYRQANEKLDEALKLAKIDNARASEVAQSGIKALEDARQNADKVKDILEEVLRARSKANAARAAIINPAAYTEAEEKLKSLARLIEEDKVARAKAGISDAMRAYENVELAALKGDIVDAASTAIEEAKRKGVDRLAPDTMKLAEQEYRLAVNTLNVDRTATPKASVYAQNALQHTQRATQIADVITHFRQSDYSEEDKVLWYQKQVERIVAPIENNVAFTEPNKDVVKKLAGKLREMVNEYESTLAALNEAKTKHTEISQEKEEALTAAKSQTEQKQLQQEALAARFSRVQSLFNPDEAEVYRQLDNVLIRAHGFSFPPGGSEIDSKNFSLMNKIIQAIEQFPEAQILVSGHTDNTGGDDLNNNLSRQRAEKVAKFLMEVGGIDPNRLSATGYGKERPVAPNETREGRAANRRVEVLIINDLKSMGVVGQIPAGGNR